MGYIYNEDVKVTLLQPFIINSNQVSDTEIYVSNPIGTDNDPPAPTSNNLVALKLVDKTTNAKFKEFITYSGRNQIAGGFILTGVSRIGATNISWKSGSYLIGTLSNEFQSNFELASNKVTNLSNPNNTEYPTTLAVSNALASISGGTNIGTKNIISVNTTIDSNSSYIVVDYLQINAGVIFTAKSNSRVRILK